MNTFPSRRDTLRGGSWTNPNPLPKTFSLEEQSKYTKRSYAENLITYPMQKLPRLESGRDPLPIAPRKPPSLLGEVPFTNKPTFEEKATKVFESGTRREFRDLSPAKASESWRTDPPSTGPVQSEEALWDEETDRDYSKNASEPDVSRWRKDRRTDYERERNPPRRYSPPQGADRAGKTFFDVKQRKDLRPSPRDSMLSENKNQGTYEKLMKVVMGSINPRASTTPHMTDRVSPSDGGAFANSNRESADGYSGPSLDAERYNNSKLPSDSFRGSSFPSSLSNRTRNAKDIPINFDSSSTDPPRWESWRNLNSTQPYASSKALNSADKYVPPSDSWRTDASKSESWRNANKPTVESAWVRPLIATEEDRFLATNRNSRGFGPAPIPFDRQLNLGARGFSGARIERNVRY